MLKKLSAKPKNIFLVDAAGATLTALLLLLVLAPFEDWFGMPRSVLYILAAMAFCFAIYSFSCFFAVTNWRLYLKVIAVANAAYCLLTLGLIILYHSLLTALGIAYFIGETIVVLSLAGNIVGRTTTGYTPNTKARSQALFPQ